MPQSELCFWINEATEYLKETMTLRKQIDQLRQNIRQTQEQNQILCRYLRDVGVSTKWLETLEDDFWRRLHLQIKNDAKAAAGRPVLDATARRRQSQMKIVEDGK